MEVLGGFHEVPPDPRPCWIVRVTSVYGRTWLMSVVPCRVPPSLIVRRIRSVPWEQWVGPTGNPLFDGDLPDEAARLKEMWSARTPETGHDDG